MTDLIAKARSACKLPIGYQLGHGGYHPNDATPSRDGLCDCSGFIAFLVGRSRKPDDKFRWWLSTDSIHDDAIGAQVLFSRIPLPVPGCIAVYPDHDGKQGHTALIVDPKTWTIIDCSRSQNGVTEHIGKYWSTTPNVVFCVPV